ncbi:MAG: helix-hairpin-helix domain-containing protein [Clostridiales bacterium]|nr:helix-hairpin-helix domain-containing protein [Clostridiales bacterium]
MRFRKDIVYPVAFVLAAAAGIGYKVVLSGKLDGMIIFPDKRDEVTVESSSDPLQSGITISDPSYHSEPSDRNIDTVSIYICGEVRNPGVYELPYGSIVNDAVNAAGGFTQDAAWQRLDLVYILTQNRTIYIPSENDIITGADISVISFDEQSETENSDDPSDASSAPGSRININTADSSELQTLPGIGPATAGLIIDYRQEHAFTSIEDIMNVSGIGEARFAAIRDLICV